MTRLDATAPLRSLRALVGLTMRAMGDTRGLSDAAVAAAEKAGSNIRLATLAEYASACGYKIVVSVERIDGKTTDGTTDE